MRPYELAEREAHPVAVHVAGELSYQLGDILVDGAVHRNDYRVFVVSRLLF
jgi:hypothetical protein